MASCNRRDITDRKDRGASPRLGQFASACPDPKATPLSAPPSLWLTDRADV